MKLITWNVQWFCGLDGRIDIDRVLRDARSMADFDVLCLQEVAVHYPRLTGDASHDQVALLRDRLPGFELAFGAGVDELAPDGRTRQRFGNVVASRLPVAQVQLQALPHPADGLVPSMPRIAVCATLLAPWGTLRVSTTHLEYYSQAMRLAQVDALRRQHAEACAHAATPPLVDDECGPFRSKRHTADAILTADFNFDASSAEYARLVAPNGAASALHDAWRLLRGDKPHDPTFRVYDRSYGPEPMACDFVFVSDGLRSRLRDMKVDGATQASDHQPVLVELDDGA